VFAFVIWIAHYPRSAVHEDLVNEHRRVSPALPFLGTAWERELSWESTPLKANVPDSFH